MNDRKFDRAYNPSAMSLEKRMNKKEDNEEDGTLLSKISGFDPSQAGDYSLGVEQSTEEPFMPEIDKGITSVKPAETKPAQDPTKVANSLESQLDRLPKGTMSEQEREQYRNRINTLLSMSEQAQNRIEKQEMTEKLINAFAQIGGALYGLKHGVDMSGMTFDKSNWDAKIDRSINSFRERIKAVEDEQMQYGKAKKEERDDALQQLLLKRQADKESRDEAFREKQLAATTATKTAAAESRAAKEAAAQAEKSRKESKADQAKIAKQEATINKEVDDVLSHPKKDNAAKAAELSRLLGVEVSEEELDTDKEGLFTGDYTALEIKNKIMAKRGTPMMGGVAPVEKVYQGKTYVQQPDGSWKAK